MNKLFITVGSLAAMLAVILGAFAAHGLKDILDPHWLDVFQTGAEYQMIHALGLILIGIIFTQHPTLSWRLRWAGYLFIVGIFLFSGSLYVLSVTQIPWLGMITPLGGMCFIVGWLLLALTALREI